MGRSALLGVFTLPVRVKHVVTVHITTTTISVHIMQAKIAVTLIQMDITARKPQQLRPT